jgi:hypothetical protein
MGVADGVGMKWVVQMVWGSNGCCRWCEDQMGVAYGVRIKWVLQMM